jgi:hypothetical protein
LKGVRRVYNRHGYEQEKADAIQAVADLVDRIVGSKRDDEKIIRPPQFHPDLDKVDTAALMAELERRRGA